MTEPLFFYKRPSRLERLLDGIRRRIPGLKYRDCAWWIDGEPYWSGVYRRINNWFYSVFHKMPRHKDIVQTFIEPSNVSLENCCFCVGPRDGENRCPCEIKGVGPYTAAPDVEDTEDK